MEKEISEFLTTDFKIRTDEGFTAYTTLSEAALKYFKEMAHEPFSTPHYYPPEEPIVIPQEKSTEYPIERMLQEKFLNKQYELSR